VDELTVAIEGEDFVFIQTLDRTESKTHFLMKDLDKTILCFETIKPLASLAQEKDGKDGVDVKVQIGDIRAQVSAEKEGPGIYLMFRPDTPECYHIGFSYATTIDQLLEKLKALKPS